VQSKTRKNPLQQTIFQPGEAEDLVRQLRHQLQESYVLDAHGKGTASLLALWRACDIRDELLKRLMPRFWADATARLSDYPQTAQEDAVLIAAESVTADLMNLSDSRTAQAYENRFNGIVDKRIRNALRTVRRQERFFKERPLSLDSSTNTSSDDDGTSEVLSDTLENRRALAELEAVFDCEILEHYRNSLSAEQLEMVEMHSRYPDLSATRLGQMLGISERTARHRLEAAEKLLVAVIQGRK